MSGKFDGFSQEDINKVSNKRTIKPVFNSRGIRRMPDSGFDGKQLKNEKRPTTNSTCVKKQENLSNNNTHGTHAPDVSVISSEEESIHFRPLSTRNTNIENNKKVETSPDESILHIEKTTSSDKVIINLNGNNEDKCSPFKGVSLKDFEAQRKIIEEQNKQRKEILYKAIELHSQKTAAEVKKIEQIKGELAKLDTDLAADVAILRKQIEAACIHYSNIQKQYNRIESQFLKAKLDLHNASEKKELLTEHLCTVIAHNEERKAKKLTELMEKVGISSFGNQIENDSNE